MGHLHTVWSANLLSSLQIDMFKVGLCYRYLLTWFLEQKSAFGKSVARQVVQRQYSYEVSGFRCLTLY